MSSVAMRVALGLIAGGLALQANGQATSEPPSSPPGEAPASGQAPPTHVVPEASVPEAAYSGCVMESATDKGTYILSADSVCAKLTGKLATGDLAGHEIDLKGVLTARVASARTPASIEVNSVGSVGKSCSNVCSLRPPGMRGLGGERPGREGGRPGATSGSQTGPQ